MSETMDKVLEVLKDSGPEYGSGFSNHGPMASEAMIVLGQGDSAVGWAERYRKRLHERPGEIDKINDENWREALGNQKRVGDWHAYFNRTFDDASWQDVLDKWVKRLAPGIMAGSTHGFIRVGHASRSLSEQVNELRLNELAEALAYWASYNQPLPTKLEGARGNGGVPPGGEAVTPRPQLPSKAIDRVETIPPEVLARYHFHLIRESMEALHEVPNFPEVINWVDTAGDASDFLSDITATFAAVYLANATDISKAISFIHTVTAPSAIRLVAPHVSPGTISVVERYAWQAAAALYTVFGQEGEGTACESFKTEWPEIIERAMLSKDEHAIKFTEACMREHMISPKPIYLAAASHATALIAKLPVEPILAKC